MRKAKTGIRTVSFLTVLMMIVLLFPSPEQAFAASTLKLTAKTVSQSAVKVSWGSQKKALKKVVKWKVRAAAYHRNGSRGKYKLVKTLKKGKKACTVKKLKKNTMYSFQVCGYVKKKGKLKLAYRGYIDGFAGIMAPDWDDYVYSDYDLGPDRIELAIYRVSQGLPVSGYELFRRDVSAGKSDYTKIADISKASFGKGEIIYTDKKVSPGGKYQYRLRSYRIGKGKKIFSDFSETITMSAVNRVGVYTWSTESCERDRITIKINSDPYNGDTRFDLYDFNYGTGDEDDYDEGLPLRIAAFSHDGVNWRSMAIQTDEEIDSDQDPVEDVHFAVMKGGASIWLTLQPDTDRPVDLTGVDPVIRSDDIRYNGLPCFFDLAMDENGSGTGTARMNLEYIH